MTSLGWKLISFLFSWATLLSGNVTVTLPLFSVPWLVQGHLDHSELVCFSFFLCAPFVLCVPIPALCQAVDSACPFLS